MSSDTDEVLYDATGETDGYAPALPLLRQASSELTARDWTPSVELALSLVHSAELALQQDTHPRRAVEVKDLLRYVEQQFRRRGAELIESNLLVAQRLRTEHELGCRLRQAKADGRLHQGGRPVAKPVSQADRFRLDDIGLNRQDSSDFQRLAELVWDDLAELIRARQETAELSTVWALGVWRQFRLGVHFSSDTAEWYTPQEIVECAIAALGAIDLDPCSNSSGAPHVPAARHFTIEDDGLAQPWKGRVYMNPPYGDQIGEWVEKLVQEYAAGHVPAAVALLPARTDTQWFALLDDALLCFIHGRLTFLGAEAGAPFPSVAAYLGPDRDRFARAFGEQGGLWCRWTA